MWMWNQCDQRVYVLRQCLHKQKNKNYIHIYIYIFICSKCKFNVHLYWISDVSMTYPEGCSYRHECPNSGAQKMKYTFIYTIILHCRLCFFLLNQIKVYFSLRKHAFSIVDHPTDCQHINIELVHTLQPL